jgi:hypothetical protein
VSRCRGYPELASSSSFHLLAVVIIEGSRGDQSYSCSSVLETAIAVYSSIRVVQDLRGGKGNGSITCILSLGFKEASMI